MSYLWKKKNPDWSRKTNVLIFFQLCEKNVSEWNGTKKMTAVSLIGLSSRAVVWWFDLAEVKLTQAAQGARAVPSLLLLLQLLFLIQCDWKYQGTCFLQSHVNLCRPFSHCLGSLWWPFKFHCWHLPWIKPLYGVFWVSQCVTAKDLQRHLPLL